MTEDVCHLYINITQHYSFFAVRKLSLLTNLVGLSLSLSLDGPMKTLGFSCNRSNPKLFHRDRKLCFRAFFIKNFVCIGRKIPSSHARSFVDSASDLNENQGFDWMRRKGGLDWGSYRHPFISPSKQAALSFLF